LAQVRYEGRDEIEVSEKLLKLTPGDPLILISSESRQMIEDAARLIASNRPIVWSADYQPSKAVQNVLDERAVNGIFYGEVAEFKFPTRIVVTRSPATAFIASSWQSPVLIASSDDSQSEVERARELLGRFPNIASITVADQELSLTPFRNLS
jgi:hypothetical protein